MTSLEQWQGGGTLLMAQPCAVQSRQLDSWDASGGMWSSFTQQAQQVHLSAEQDYSDSVQEQQHQQHPPMKASGCKRGGRPVTWIGGGGMDPKKLAGLGVPVLRTLFASVFGQETASNNAAWLRRKLAEAPDSVLGQRRSPVVRARDQGAAIWNQDTGRPADPDSQLELQLHVQPCMQDGQQLTAQEHVFAGSSMLVDDMQQPGGVLREQQQMHLGNAERLCSTTPAVHSPHGSPAVGPLTKSPRAGALHGSPSTTLGKRSRHTSSQKVAHRQHLEPHGCCYASGTTLRHDTITECCSGRKVLVYWPADQQWWEATLCGVDPGLRQLQLLYADMTEECISGNDYDDLLANGHLLDVQDAQPGPAADEESAQVPEMTSLDEALRQPPGPLTNNILGSSMSGLSNLPCAVQGGAMSACSQGRLLPDSSMLSCSVLLPDMSPQPQGTDAGVTPVAVSPGLMAYDQGSPSPGAAAVALTHNSSRRSTRDGFQLSGSGSGCGGSGNNSADGDPEGQGAAVAKRQCYELSGVSSDAAAVEPTNMAADPTDTRAEAAPMPGSYPPTLPQQQQQAQQPQQQLVAQDPSQLSLWFANQQLQQLHLQEQQQQNLVLQQQAHLQMQQQMAAHMQMRMAEQLMQQQMTASPYSMAGAAVAAAAAAGMFGMPAFPATSVGTVQQQLLPVNPPGLSLPAISVPPNGVALQQLVPPNAAAAVAAAANQCMSPMAAMALYSPLAASTAAALGAWTTSPGGPLSPGVYGQQQQLVQQAAKVATSPLEPTSPLARAAVAAAAAAAWPAMSAPLAENPSSAAMMAVAAAAVAAINSPTVAGRTSLPQHLGCCSTGVVQGASPLGVQQPWSAATLAPAPPAATLTPELFGQLPLPQPQLQPQAPLQPALPEAAAPVMPSALGTAACVAAEPEAGLSKPAKAVSIKADAEYCTYAQNWLDGSGVDAGDATTVPAAARAAEASAQRQGAGLRAPTPAVPAISGTTVGCVSGFTGGVQGVEALDEVDTLLSRPEEGLYGGLGDGLEGCGMGAHGCDGSAASDVCWDLLDMSAAGEPQAFTSQADGQQGSNGRGCGRRLSISAGLVSSSRDDRPASVPEAAGGAFAMQGLSAEGLNASQEPVGAAANMGVAQWGPACVPAAPAAAGLAPTKSSRPNSALAHVFDYA